MKRNIMFGLLSVVLALVMVFDSPVTLFAEPVCGEEPAEEMEEDDEVDMDIEIQSEGLGDRELMDI